MHPLRHTSPGHGLARKLPAARIRPAFVTQPMKPRTLIFGLLGGVVLAMPGIRSAAWAQKDTAFNEPVSYCKAVGDIDAPDATKEPTAGRQIFKVDAQDYPSE